MAEFRHRQIEIRGASLHVIEAGDADAPPMLFLHGWPESADSWQALMSRASERTHAIAIDLPGIGRSTGEAGDGSKHQLAETVHELVAAMRLRDVTLVGQDVGGMVVYAYLRTYTDIARAVIMDVVVPGVDPWEEVLRNPYIWHFALHAIPSLPELLVHGRERRYFDYFYDGLSADATKITSEARAAYVSAYSSGTALTVGFNWYRAFAADARANAESAAGARVATPLLYIRGERESGDIDSYVDGFRKSGVEYVEHALVPGAGHFTQEEAPDETWRLIARFAGIEGDNASPGS